VYHWGRKDRQNKIYASNVALRPQHDPVRIRIIQDGSIRPNRRERTIKKEKISVSSGRGRRRGRRSRRTTGGATAERLAVRNAVIGIRQRFGRNPVIALFVGRSSQYRIIHKRICIQHVAGETSVSSGAIIIIAHYDVVIKYSTRHVAVEDSAITPADGIAGKTILVNTPV